MALTVGLLFCAEAGVAMHTFVTNLYRLALDEAWEHTLMEACTMRALQDFGASCSAVATAVADWDKSTGGAGTANTLSELVERATELNRHRDLFNTIVLDPLMDPEKTLALIVEEQDHVERRRMRDAARTAAAASQLKTLAPLGKPAVTKPAGGTTAKPTGGALVTRARGGPGPEALDDRERGVDSDVAQPLWNEQSLTTRLERRLAAAAVGGRCLGFLSAGGCPRLSGCSFRHATLSPEEQRGIGPAVACVLAAGGGPRWAPLAPDVDRKAVVEALRQLASLTRGRGAPLEGPSSTPTSGLRPAAAPFVPGLIFDATGRHPLGQRLARTLVAAAPSPGHAAIRRTAALLPDDANMAVLRAYSSVVQKHHPWLSNEPESVQALVYNHGFLTHRAHPEYTLEEVFAATRAALLRSTLPGSGEAAARLGPAPTRARGPEVTPAQRERSALTGELLIQLLGTPEVQPGTEVESKVHILEQS